MDQNIKIPGLGRIIHWHPYAGRYLYGVIIMAIVTAVMYFGLIDVCDYGPEFCEEAVPETISIFVVLILAVTPPLIINMGYQVYKVKQIFKNGVLIQAEVTAVKGGTKNIGGVFLYQYPYDENEYSGRGKVWWNRDWDETGFPFFPGVSVPIVVNSNKPHHSAVIVTYYPPEDTYW